METQAQIQLLINKLKQIVPSLSIQGMEKFIKLNNITLNELKKYSVNELNILVKKTLFPSKEIYKDEMYME